MGDYLRWRRRFIKVSRYLLEEMFPINYFLRNLAFSAIFINATLNRRNNGVKVGLEEERHRDTVFPRFVNDTV